MKLFVPLFTWSDPVHVLVKQKSTDITPAFFESISDDDVNVWSLGFWEFLIIQSVVQTYFWEMRIHNGKNKIKTETIFFSPLERQFRCNFKITVCQSTCKSSNYLRTIKKWTKLNNDLKCDQFFNSTSHSKTSVLCYLKIFTCKSDTFVNKKTSSKITSWEIIQRIFTSLNS